MKNFIILYRYEYWSKKGKKWSRWCVADSTARTLEDATQRIEELKSGSAHTTKIVKLKYEYKTKRVG